jgi:hypothetical protein
MCSAPTSSVRMATANAVVYAVPDELPFPDSDQCPRDSSLPVSDYRYVSQVSLGEMTGEILIQYALGLIGEDAKAVTR